MPIASGEAAAGQVDPAAHLVRGGDGLRGREVLRAELVDAGDAEQAHCGDELALEDLEDTDDAVFARCGGAPALQLADRDGIGTEGEGFGDVAAALDAAIDDDPGAT